MHKSSNDQHFYDTAFGHIPALASHPYSKYELYLACLCSVEMKQAQSIYRSHSQVIYLLRYIETQ